MIAEAIEKVLGLGEIRQADFNGHLFARERDGLERIKRPEEHRPEALLVSSLNALVAYLAANPDGLDVADLFIHVESRKRVELLGPLQPKNDNLRFNYVGAAFTPPSFEFGRWYPVDDFIMAFQAAFIPTDEFDAVVCMLANIANEAVKQSVDDGFSQTIQVKTGLTTKSEVKVQNPVRLRPIFTFREAEQPLGDFILRLKDQGADRPPAVALFHADLPLLQLEATAEIYRYLRGRLEEEGLLAKVLV